MKALFLACGRGTRLKPLTDHLPKPMVPMMVKPLLERNMLKLKESGVDEIILSTCYKPQKFEEYFGDGSKLGLKIQYICEDIPLGTGGAIKYTESFFDETYIVFNSDILSDINITDMIKFHKQKSAAVTIAVTKVANPSAYGVIEYNENCYASSFTEKPKMSEIKSNYINAGIYIFEPYVLKEIPSGKVVSVERETYPLLLQKGYPIAVYKSDAYWMDIGTLEKYTEAHRDILSGKCHIPEYKAGNQNTHIGLNTMVQPSVKIISPVYIGENVKIGTFSTIGPNAVIGDNCRIGTGCTVENSILWGHARVESGSEIADTILTSNCALRKNFSHPNVAAAQMQNRPIAVTF